MVQLSGNSFWGPFLLFCQSDLQISISLTNFQLYQQNNIQANNNLSTLNNFIINQIKMDRICRSSTNLERHKKNSYNYISASQFFIAIDSSEDESVDDFYIEGDQYDASESPISKSIPETNHKIIDEKYENVYSIESDDSNSVSIVGVKKPFPQISMRNKVSSITKQQLKKMKRERKLKRRQEKRQQNSIREMQNIISVDDNKKQEFKLVPSSFERVSKPIKGFSLTRNFALQQLINQKQKLPSLMYSLFEYNFGSHQKIHSEKIPNSFKNFKDYKIFFQNALKAQLFFNIREKLLHLNNQLSFNVKIVSYKTSERYVELKVQQLEVSKQIKYEFRQNISKFRLCAITTQKYFRVQDYGVCHETLSLVCSFDGNRKMREYQPFTLLVSKEILITKMNLVGIQLKLYDLDKITTEARQFQAIANLQNNPFCSLILQTQQKQIYEQPKINSLAINTLLGRLKLKYNSTQFQAIEGINKVNNTKMMFLQGPPGTGKTQTIMGVIACEYQKLKNYKDLYPQLSPKILICAPSNAAVNHLVKRIIEKGILHSDSDIIIPKIIRFGVLQSEQQVVKSVSFYDIVEDIFGKQRNCAIQNMNIQVRLHQLRMELAESNISKEKKLKKSNIKIVLEYIKTLKSNIGIKQLINKVQKFLINNQAEILLTTLTSSFSQKIINTNPTFSCLIIDEAAQCTQPNFLIPLQFGMKKIVVVGDPQQLPATTKNTNSVANCYNRSLFGRFMQNNFSPYFLQVQYRMLPSIREFPSNNFYEGRLRDAEEIKKRKSACQLLQKFKGREAIFINYEENSDRNQKFMNNSYENDFQAKTITEIVFKLLQTKMSIGVITPYTSQKMAIWRYIRQKQKRQTISFPSISCIQKRVSVNTVDSYQGQERDIILISMVRSNTSKKIGFTSDDKRMNVSLTRAKSFLVTVGNRTTLENSSKWSSYISNAQNRKSLFTIKKESTTNKKALSFSSGNGEEEIIRKFVQELFQVEKNVFFKNGIRYEPLSQIQE